MLPSEGLDEKTGIFVMKLSGAVPNTRLMQQRSMPLHATIVLTTPYIMTQGDLCMEACFQSLASEATKASLGSTDSAVARSYATNRLDKHTGWVQGQVCVSWKGG